MSVYPLEPPHSGGRGGTGTAGNVLFLQKSCSAEVGLWMRWIAASETLARTAYLGLEQSDSQELESPSSRRFVFHTLFHTASKHAGQSRNRSGSTPSTSWIGDPKHRMGLSGTLGTPTQHTPKIANEFSFCPRMATV